MVQKSTMNQLANSQNPFQGKAKRVLCICSAGLLRSPTAALVLHKEFGYNTRSAGIGDSALVSVSQALIRWAEEIVCMEDFHKQLLLTQAKNLLTESEFQRLEGIIKVLSIPDQFEFMDSELQQLIIKAYKEVSIE